MTDVRGIVREYLVAHGYDGLTHCEDWDGCGCGLDDLIACDEACHHCKPAYGITWDTCQYRDEDGCPEGLDRATCGGCYSLVKPEEHPHD